MAVIGVGLLSCGNWTAARRSGVASGPEQWVLGFLSGVGIADAGYDPLRSVDAEGVWGWFDNYCGARPLEKIAAAAKAFIVAHPR
jgi:hypothetical protein